MGADGVTGEGLLALVGAGLLGITAAFQLALGLGAPWASAAYGGRVAGPDGRLPGRYRVSSLGTVVLLVAIASLLLVEGGVIRSAFPAPPLATVGVWVAAGLFAVNTLANLAARHPLERWGMGAVTAALTAVCVLLAITP